MLVDQKAADSILANQVSFELPQGLATTTGPVYRQGKMRLATGEDELMAQQAVQMLENNAYGVLVRLSRVASFDGHPPLTADDIGNLFMPDLTYLLNLYNALNPPHCELSVLGEPVAIPQTNCPRR